MYTIYVYTYNNSTVKLLYGTITELIARNFRLGFVRARKTFRAQVIFDVIIFGKKSHLQYNFSSTAETISRPLAYTFILVWYMIFFLFFPKKIIFWILSCQVGSHNDPIVESIRRKYFTPVRPFAIYSI